MQLSSTQTEPESTQIRFRLIPEQDIHLEGICLIYRIGISVSRDPFLIQSIGITPSRYRLHSSSAKQAAAIGLEPI